MNISRFLRTLLCALLVCFCVPLFAQEYVVTASRTSVDVLDSPANTTVITAEEIEKSGNANLVQVLKTVPSLHISSYSSDAQAQISMRGFGENSFGRVLVMIDGRSINNPDMNGTNLLSVPLSAIERIEILDGPASALYGNNAVGGVINIITKESAQELIGTISLSAGSFWTINPQFSLSSSTETTGFSVSIDQFNTEGWRERTGVKSTNALINSYIDFSDTITLKPSFFFTDSYYELPGPLTKTQFEDKPQQAINQDDDSSLFSLGGNIALYWEVLPSIEVLIPMGYEYKKLESNLASSSSFQDTNQHRIIFKPNLTFASAISQKIDLSIISGVDTGGTFYKRTSFTAKARNTEKDKMNTSQFYVAPYLQTKLAFSNFTVSATARYDASFLNSFNGTADTDGKTIFSAPILALDINYRPIEQFSVYARASNLFRYPFLDEIIALPYYTQPASFNSDLKAETGYNAELGLKTDFGDVFSATLSGYYMPMENEIAYVFDPSTYTGKNKNLDETLHAGGSIALQTMPTDFFAARISISYTHAVFSAGQYKNKRIPLVSALSAQASIDFSFVGITLTPDILFKGESFQAGDNANLQDTIPSYFLLGLAASYNVPLPEGNLLLIAQAQNLLNTIYSPYVYYGYYPAEGRRFSLSGRYSF